MYTCHDILAALLLTVIEMSHHDIPTCLQPCFSHRVPDLLQATNKPWYYRLIGSSAKDMRLQSTKLSSGFQL